MDKRKYEKSSHKDIKETNETSLQSNAPDLIKEGITTSTASTAKTSYAKNKEIMTRFMEKHALSIFPNHHTETQSQLRPEVHDSSQALHNPEIIQDLVSKFIDIATNGTQIQGVSVTDKQYEDIKEYLLVLKNNKAITKDIYTKALNSAYKRTNNGKESIRIQNTRIEVKEAKSQYDKKDSTKLRRSERRKDEVGKKIVKNYNSSDKGKKSRTAYNKRIRLLKTDQGRKQLQDDRRAWEKGERELPEYITTSNQYDEFIEKNRDKIYN